MIYPLVLEPKYSEIGFIPLIKDIQFYCLMLEIKNGKLLSSTHKKSCSIVVLFPSVSKKSQHFDKCCQISYRDFIKFMVLNEPLKYLNLEFVGSILSITDDFWFNLPSFTPPTYRINSFTHYIQVFMISFFSIFRRVCFCFCQFLQ